MAEIPFIVVPKALREQLGEDGAEALVGLLNQVGAYELREFRLGVEAAVNNLAATVTRDISSLAARMREGENALRTAIADLRSQMEKGDNTLRAAIADLRSEMEKGENTLHAAIADLRSEMEKGENTLRTAMQEGDNALRLEMREGFASLRTETHALVSRSHISLIKWMFAFWAGQVAVVLGILKLVGAL
ncbi:MAG: hypothetical protein QME87_03375 [Bacillota bacterium]|nr:hypothetical protein [Bacillota bacterium]